MGLEISFWILAVIITASALAVVLLPNIFRSALALVACFLAVAGIFVTLSADFLAAVQVLIYVGAIAILIILSIMLTREVQRGNLSNRLKLPAFFICAVLLSITIFAMLNTSWPVSAEAPLETTTSTLANVLFSQDGMFLLVEIGAMLLLATIIGAITIVRDK
jgi:NADH-quinone oxidoreductase subunit J